MFKFRFLLWAMTRLLQRAVRNNPACASHVAGKELAFQIRTRDGVGRHFSIRNGTVSSKAGLAANPNFTLTFRDAGKGFATLSAKDSKDAFLAALQKEDLVISGDFIEVLWFQQLTDYLQPGKAQDISLNT